LQQAKLAPPPKQLVGPQLPRHPLQAQAQLRLTAPTTRRDLPARALPPLHQSQQAQQRLMLAHQEPPERALSRARATSPLALPSHRTAPTSWHQKDPALVPASLPALPALPAPKGRWTTAPTPVLRALKRAPMAALTSALRVRLALWGQMGPLECAALPGPRA
jgi:hypothetical protein